MLYGKKKWREAPIYVRAEFNYVLFFVTNYVLFLLLNMIETETWLTKIVTCVGSKKARTTEQKRILFNDALS
jgi:hypothetical protein